MKRLGETMIPCIIMEGDERMARMWEISENLHRVELTPFEHDEQVAEWVRLMDADRAIPGQNVQKSRRGRGKGGVSEAARQLPVKGKTHEAKRKNVQRAVKVDSIFPEAKEAAKKAGLDHNRPKLLKVAAEETLEAQLAKVHELEGRKSDAASRTALSGEEKRALKLLLKAWNNARDLKRAFVKSSVNVRKRFVIKIQRQTVSSTRDGWSR